MYCICKYLLLKVSLLRSLRYISSHPHLPPIPHPHSPPSSQLKINLRTEHTQPDKPLSRHLMHCCISAFLHFCISLLRLPPASPPQDKIMSNVPSLRRRFESTDQTRYWVCTCTYITDPKPQTHIDV